MIVYLLNKIITYLVRVKNQGIVDLGSDALVIGAGSAICLALSRCVCRYILVEGSITNIGGARGVRWRL